MDSPLHVNHFAINLRLKSNFLFVPRHALRLKQFVCLRKCVESLSVFTLYALEAENLHRQNICTKNVVKVLG